jgi:hypothetical protein
VTTECSPEHADHASWVAAAPFRSWFRRLCAETRLGPEVVAVAIGIPSRTARALLAPAGRGKRLRRLDAEAIMLADPDQIAAEAARSGCAALARHALAEAGLSPTPEELAEALRTDLATARGLLSGRLDICPQLLVWRARALAEASDRSRLAHVERGDLLRATRRRPPRTARSFADQLAA